MAKLLLLGIFAVLYVSSVQSCRSFSEPLALDAARKAHDTQTCQACLLGVRLVDDSLCDEGVNEFLVKFFLKKVCVNMKEKEQCEALAVSLMPVAIQYLRASMVPSRVCGDAGVCGSQLRSFPDYAKAHFNPPNTIGECSFCKFVVTRLQVALQNPQTEAEVKEVAIEACKDFPTEMQDACVQYINTHEAEILVLIDTMAPGKICELAGACLPQLVASHPLPALTAELARSLASLYYVPKTAGVAVNDANDLCDTCKIVVLEAHQMLTNPKTQKQVEDFLEQLCSSFGSYADECQALMDEYLPMLLEVVAEYLEPETLCTEIGYCKPRNPLMKLLDAVRSSVPMARAHTVAAE